MEDPVFRNKEGMTLLEVMIALVLLMIISLALVKMSLLAMDTNVQNEMRDAAVSVAEQRMNELRNTPFTDPLMLATPGTVESAITATVRSVPQSFTPTRAITDINSTTKQVALYVSWVYHGMTYTHSITTVLRSQ